VRPVLSQPASSHALQTDAWLAGFTDGEGHFDIAPLRGARFPEGAFQPRFEIKLRGDDAEILTELHAAFGGGMRTFVDSRGRSCAKWTVQSKVGLAALVNYFDSFSLRAKKARDYAVWRGAVELYVEEGYRAPGLVAYHDQLRALRA
jgi:hypothetical protein